MSWDVAWEMCEAVRMVEWIEMRVSMRSRVSGRAETGENDSRARTMRFIDDDDLVREIDIEGFAGILLKEEVVR